MWVRPNCVGLGVLSLPCSTVFCMHDGSDFLLHNILTRCLTNWKSSYLIDRDKLSRTIAQNCYFSRLIYLISTHVAECLFLLS